MRIVLAIDSFKGCLSSVEVESSVEKGVKLSCPQAEVEKIPVSDGGDGMLEVFSQLVGCEKVTVACHDALMRPIQAEYAISPSGVVVLETAVACGINLLKSEELNPLRATSYGVGEVIADALLRGYHSYIIGLGGSATSDCGLGMLAALKRKLGEDWQNKLPKDLDIILASDVANPLFGDTGAAVVFGPQKGATPEMIACLDRRARTFARLAAKHFGFDHSEDKGAGAAGGLGYAFLQFLGAKIKSGADVMLQMSGFENLVKEADLIVTGEGRADAQTLMGKIPECVLAYGKRLGVPVVLLAGQVKDKTALLSAGFSQVCCINPTALPLVEAMVPSVAKENIRKTVMRKFKGWLDL